MRIYIAARYDRRFEMLGVTSALMRAGHEVTSRWIRRGRGEDPELGLPSRISRDLGRADCLVSFTEEPAAGVSWAARGGRHVEFGIALAAGKRLCVVGPRENIFHFLPTVEVYASITDLMRSPDRPSGSQAMTAWGVAPARGRFRICGTCGARLAFVEVKRPGQTRDAEGRLFAAIREHLQVSARCRDAGTFFERGIVACRCERPLPLKRDEGLLCGALRGIGLARSCRSRRSRTEPSCAPRCAMNIDPILMCGRCDAPKLHIFVERRPAPHLPGELLYDDLLYACDGCGAVRGWGNEPREETAYGRWLSKEAFAHAVDRHGMRRGRCPACRGAAVDCDECGDEGKAWVFDRPGALWARLPDRRAGRPEDE